MPTDSPAITCRLTPFTAGDAAAAACEEAAAPGKRITEVFDFEQRRRGHGRAAAGIARRPSSGSDGWLRMSAAV